MADAPLKAVSIPYFKGSHRNIQEKYRLAHALMYQCVSEHPSGIT